MSLVKLECGCAKLGDGQALRLSPSDPNFSDHSGNVSLERLSTRSAPSCSLRCTAYVLNYRIAHYCDPEIGLDL